MSDSLSTLIAVGVLAIGGLGILLYTSSDEQRPLKKHKKASKEEESEDEDEDESEDEDEDESSKDESEEDDDEESDVSEEDESSEDDDTIASPVQRKGRRRTGKKA
jgi:FtsZ-interacting cell division protein ZipA